MSQYPACTSCLLLPATAMHQTVRGSSESVPCLLLPACHAAPAPTPTSQGCSGGEGEGRRIGFLCDLAYALSFKSDCSCVGWGRQAGGLVGWEEGGGACL